MSQMPPMTPNYSGPMPGAAKPAGMSVAAMVLGIVSFFMCFIPYIGLIGWVTSILAVILGIVARGKAKRGEIGGAGMALAGMILGIVWLSIAILAIILAVAFGMTFLNWAKKTAEQQQQMQQQQRQSGQNGSLMPIFAQHADAVWNILTTFVLR
jgi:hypothetical protein